MREPSDDRYAFRPSIRIRQDREHRRHVRQDHIEGGLGENRTKVGTPSSQEVQLPETSVQSFTAERTNRDVRVSTSMALFAREDGQMFDARRKSIHPTHGESPDWIMLVPSLDDC